MKHKVITTEQGKVVATDKSIKLVRGDWHIEKELIINQFPDYLTDLDDCKKILYTINFSIDKDIPMIVVKDEVEDLAVKWFKEKRPNFTVNERSVNGYIAGYKARGGYSEEDLIIIFEATKNHKIKESNAQINLPTIKEYIQSLKQEYIEVDMEDYAVGNYGMSDGEPTIDSRVKTTRDKDGQLIAYQESPNN